MIKKLLKSLFSQAPDEPAAVVKTAYAPDGRHRVVFFRRPSDGACGFREEFYDDKVLEMTWTPVETGGSEKYEDMDSAIAAAMAAFPWLHGAM